MIEPSACTIEPGGILLNILILIFERIGVGGSAENGIILPDAVVILPAKLLFAVFAGAIVTPRYVLIDPSD